MNLTLLCINLFHKTGLVRESFQPFHNFRLILIPVNGKCCIFESKCCCKSNRWIQKVIRKQPLSWAIRYKYNTSQSAVSYYSFKTAKPRKIRDMDSILCLLIFYFKWFIINDNRWNEIVHPGLVVCTCRVGC